MLNGRVIGDVFASNRVELAPKARVTGTVCYDLLEMSMGAEVNGQLVHSQDAEPRRLGYDEPAVDQDELSGDELSASS